MGLLRTFLHYASVAWSVVTGIPGDVGDALSKVWHFTGSMYSLLAHLYSRIGKDVLSAYLHVLSDAVDAITGQNSALDRVRTWIYKYYIVPTRTFLVNLIIAIAVGLTREINAVKALTIRLYYLSLKFTVRQVAIERSARIADVRAARAYAEKLVKALQNALELEAADAYNSHTKDRVSVVTKLVDEIANRNPAVRGLVREFIDILIELLGTENPVLRFVLNQIVSHIVDGLGIDKGLGDLLQLLLGPLVRTPQAHSIGDAIGDLAQRTGTLEDQWSQFMIDGGTELEQAGEEWKDLTSFTASAALLAFFGAAVADPGGWAAAISDTVGVAVSDSAAAVAHLIRSV